MVQRTPVLTAEDDDDPVTPHRRAGRRTRVGRAVTAATGGVRVRRWQRYGQDRLYVTAADGALVGWYDLVTLTAHPAAPGQAAALGAALTAWRERAAPVPGPDGAGTVGGAWTDLAGRRPGTMPRAQAAALRREAPVRTFFARVIGLPTPERARRVAARAEERVATGLERLVRRDPRWRILHAVPVGPDGCDIDHVVIGPAGVFTIRAAYHPGARVWVSGDNLLVDGVPQPYVGQGRAEAARAARRLTAACGFEVAVTGLVVPVRAKEVVVRAGPAGAAVVERVRLGRWLAGRPEVLDGVRVAAIYAAARRSLTWTAATGAAASA
ncbi:nuclease-related domain-containing protein [Georgenia ruanii]|nr:nuclease-related domain-containing protein [Georgenia ruanii]MPV89226.1 hypothetical protein [Georgenia ruanii]